MMNAKKSLLALVIGLATAASGGAHAAKTLTVSDNITMHQFGSGLSKSKVKAPAVQIKGSWVKVMIKGGNAMSDPTMKKIAGRKLYLLKGKMVGGRFEVSSYVPVIKIMAKK